MTKDGRKHLDFHIDFQINRFQFNEDKAKMVDNFEKFAQIMSAAAAIQNATDATKESNSEALKQVE